ncbi:APC amino acid permease [Armillaria borealis]|uniref:APC amino acid permease n=1 Tax=Armillaria borealis TaxID=47425 RepID=A0AA39JY16_9AGAR|nr:APC amino acid permease [Armillaria borealis]
MTSGPDNDDERQSLLNTRSGSHYDSTKIVVVASGIDGAAVHRNEGDSRNGESYDDVPQAKRQLGLFSAIFLVFNRIIGTGIYATPSNILRSSGSPGLALVMWLAGASIAAVGTAVYVELGTGLPRSGGEKNYLEFIYRRPKFLATCLFSVYAIITGSSAANSLVFGEYVLHALNIEPFRWNTRFVAFLCLSFCCLLHGTTFKWGLRLQNTLGLFKLFLLSSIGIAGLFCVVGVPGFRVRDEYEAPDNLRWDKLWQGSNSDANALISGLYNIIWSFVGYSTANYALSEVRNPVRTIKRAAPLALISVTAVYLLVNVGYFAVVSKGDIVGSRRIVAALFFRNLFGPNLERVLSIFIALSTLGNLLTGQFSQGRIIQELGREGVIPLSWFFASNKPFNAPLAGLATNWFFSTMFMVLPPPGDAYLFMISLSSYCLAIINALVSVGLLLLYTSTYKAWNWDPPFRAPKIVIVLFFLSNVFLVLVPLIPPAPGSRTYEHLPYWSHAVVAFAVSLIGVGYWYVWCVWLPRKRGYRLERTWVLQEDGVSRCVFRQIPL